KPEMSNPAITGAKQPPCNKAPFHLPAPVVSMRDYQQKDRTRHHDRVVMTRGGRQPRLGPLSYPKGARPSHGKPKSFCLILCGFFAGRRQGLSRGAVQPEVPPARRCCRRRRAIVASDPSRV